tara:strand:- start:904 stop:1251 length:348 start_codon:yes stop_codon:yes gene_type:complete
MVKASFSLVISAPDWSRLNHTFNGVLKPLRWVVFISGTFTHKNQCSRFVHPIVSDDWSAVPIYFFSTFIQENSLVKRSLLYEANYFPINQASELLTTRREMLWTIIHGMILNHPR